MDRTILTCTIPVGLTGIFVDDRTKKTHRSKTPTRLHERGNKYTTDN